MNKKILVVSLITIAIDQISKTLIEVYLDINQSISLIKNFFSITYIQNTGAAWGMFHNNTLFLIILSFIMLILIYRYMYVFKMNKKNTFAFGILLGGIVGNLLDRIILGHVRDFLDFNIFGYDFPVFNVSDMCIVVGIILLIIAVIKGEEVSAKNSSKNKSKKNR